MTVLPPFITRLVANRTPTHLEGDARVRARLVLSFALALSLVAVGFGALFVALDLPIAELGAGVALMSMLAAILLLRRLGKVNAAARVILFGGWLALLLILVGTGGIAAASFGWFGLVPIVALTLGGFELGRVTVVLVLASVIVPLALELGGLVPPSEVSPQFDAAYRFAVGVGLIAVLTLFSYLHESSRVQMHDAVVAANAALVVERDRAQVAAAELRDAQERLIAETEHQRKLEIELNLAHKLEAVGRLAAGVAHEINTPLQSVLAGIVFAEESVAELARVISGYRRLIAESSATEKLPQLLAEMDTLDESADLAFLLENLPGAVVRSQEELRRIASIVSALREFASGDTARMSECDVNRAIETTLTIAGVELREHADVELELGDIPRVRGHASELNDAFLAVLMNASQAIAAARGAHRRGRIHIRTESLGDAVRITVRDTGHGIPDEIRHRIFDPFFTTREVGQHSGQSLAIARSIIVDRHRGALTFESIAGEGTTFRLTLPIDQRRTEARSASDVASE